jgi:hypothetical protein
MKYVAAYESAYSHKEIGRLEQTLLNPEIKQLELHKANKDYQFV